MSEDEFFERIRRLAVHLDEVFPIFDAFCAKHGFARENPLALGRYPRYRIFKVDADGVNRWFDLWMELTPEGTRYTEFFEAIPYELGAGASVTFPNETEHGYRFSKTYACFSNRPFHEVPRTLMEELEKNLPVLNSWTGEFLQKEGLRVQFGGESQTGHAVMLYAWRKGALKISATQVIREYSKMGLAEAKSTVDRCLEGKATVFTFDRRDQAIRFSEAMGAIGFLCELERNDTGESVSGYPQ
ncbi:hypothetical protein BH09VER1_BH09VER1_00420 [soil metagenome]